MHLWHAGCNCHIKKTNLLTRPLQMQDVLDNNTNRRRETRLSVGPPTTVGAIQEEPTVGRVGRFLGDLILCENVVTSGSHLPLKISGTRVSRSVACPMTHCFPDTMQAPYKHARLSWRFLTSKTAHSEFRPSPLSRGLA